MSEIDVNAAYAAAAKCEHLLQGVCLTCVGVSLAAAEERGRRRGFTEGTEAAADVVQWADEKAKIRALAPRDSGKEG